MDDGYYYCKDCQDTCTIIYNNIPGLKVEYCPFCGSENIEWRKE